MNIVLALVVTTGMLVHYGMPYVATTADSLVVGKPAALAGLRAGDSIAAINGVPLASWDSLVAKISASAGKELDLDVRRGTATHSNQRHAGGRHVNESGDGKKWSRVGRIGIMPRQLTRPVPIGGGDWQRMDDDVGMAGTVLEALSGLATREVAPSELGGPIMIATASVQAARGGLQNLLVLIALISVNLAVFNLLPIPILDGGQIMVNILEAIKGSAFSARTREYILRAGLAAVLLLFALVTYNDLRRLVLGLMKHFG